MQVHATNAYDRKHMEYSKFERKRCHCGVCVHIEGIKLSESLPLVRNEWVEINRRRERESTAVLVIGMIVFLGSY